MAVEKEAVAMAVEAKAVAGKAAMTEVVELVADSKGAERAVARRGVEMAAVELVGGQAEGREKVVWTGAVVTEVATEVLGAGRAETRVAAVKAVLVGLAEPAGTRVVLEAVGGKAER